MYRITRCASDLRENNVRTNHFNAPDGAPYQLITLQNENGMRVQFLDWGATWPSCKVPVNDTLREVLLGCKVENYPTHQSYLGASVGRYANRIANAQFELNGELIKLSSNQGKHQLHGGEGFDKRRWTIQKCGKNFVCFHYIQSMAIRVFLVMWMCL